MVKILKNLRRVYLKWAIFYSYAHLGSWERKRITPDPGTTHKEAGHMGSVSLAVSVPCDLRLGSCDLVRVSADLLVTCDLDGGFLLADAL